MQNFKNQLTVFTLLVTFFSQLAAATDFHSPRTDALGGAGHASPLLGDAIYMNPSFTSFMKTHSFTFNYLKFSGNPINSPNGLVDYYGNNINLSVVDGTPDSLFQAGVGYTRRDDATMLHLGGSKSIVDKYGIGVGGKFIFPRETNAERFSDTTISFTGLLNTWFQTSLIIDNLLETAPARGFYREIIIGTKFNFNPYFMIYIDPHWAPNQPGSQGTFGYQAGIEFPVFQDLFIRAGKFKNSMIPYQAQRGDGFGFGGGWVAPKLSLDYSFSRADSPVFANSHNFGVSVYF